MENSLRSWSLARSTLRSLGRSSHSLKSGDSGIVDSEYTHVPTNSGCSSAIHPSLWIKIKYPIEADDAARSGMLSSCDFDEVLEKLQQVMSYNYFTLSISTSLCCHRYFKLGKYI